MQIAIIILSLSVLIPLGLFAYSYFERLRIRQLRKRGVEAQAILLNIQQTGIYINRLAQVKLQMQVYPKVGRNFITEVFEVMDRSDFKQMRVGDIVLVKYNPSNTKEVMILML